MNAWQSRKGTALLIAMLNPEMTLMQCAQKVCEYHHAIKRATQKSLSRKAAQAIRTRKFNSNLPPIPEE